MRLRRCYTNNLTGLGVGGHRQAPNLPADREFFMRVAAVFLCTFVMATAGLASAADRPPFYAAGGFGLFDSEIRTLTKKFPWRVGIGWGETPRA